MNKFFVTDMKCVLKGHFLFEVHRYVSHLEYLFRGSFVKVVLCKCQSSTRDLLTIIFLVNILTTFWCIQQTVFLCQVLK